MRSGARDNASRGLGTTHIVALLLRVFVAFLIVDGAGVVTTLSLFAGDHSETVECCTDCPLDSSGGECPTQCPVCQCSHSAAALPQSSYEVALNRVTAPASMPPIPYDVRVSKAPLRAGLYRPPRSFLSFA